MEVFNYIGIDIGYVLLGTISVTIIMLIMIIVLIVKQSKLKKKYNAFMEGSDAKSLEKVVTERFNEVESIKGNIQDIINRLDGVDEFLLSTYNKMSLIKYDAFREMGGNLSFAVALLTEQNNGFIINAMHSSREGCYIYAKEIKNGQCEMILADEEKQALDEAMRK